MYWNPVDVLLPCVFYDATLRWRTQQTDLQFWTIKNLKKPVDAHLFLDSCLFKVPNLNPNPVMSASASRRAPLRLRRSVVHNITAPLQKKLLECKYPWIKLWSTECILVEAFIRTFLLSCNKQWNFHWTNSCDCRDRVKQGSLWSSEVVSLEAEQHQLVSAVLSTHMSIH